MKTSELNKYIDMLYLNFQQNKLSYFYLLSEKEDLKILYIFHEYKLCSIYVAKKAMLRLKALVPFIKNLSETVNFRGFFNELWFIST